MLPSTDLIITITALCHCGQWHMYIAVCHCVLPLRSVVCHRCLLLCFAIVVSGVCHCCLLLCFAIVASGVCHCCLSLCFPNVVSGIMSSLSVTVFAIIISGLAYVTVTCGFSSLMLPLLSYLSGLEVILDAVLKSLPFDLHGSDDQRIAQEVTRVANAFACTETTQVERGREKW